ncbi:hypothetical protein [Nocardia farcinica]|uniref:hypothetical protein n=1 Tax=Nocardia farcinica TaxID=37329 RepID=UPI0010C945FD|nr:hypothetical protein [Nocardia farcinica]
MSTLQWSGDREAFLTGGGSFVGELNSRYRNEASFLDYPDALLDVGLVELESAMRQAADWTLQDCVNRGKRVPVRPWFAIELTSIFNAQSPWLLLEFNEGGNEELKLYMGLRISEHFWTMSRLLS